ncbi:hypothetical protein NQT66_19380 [Cellulophaga baltica]|uniref:hypothetical protein n=1 Tax=Cellulophaga baltica TaxID=76594 RepID=UPI002147EA53|nr:hypothetical protein [Cellulophaga baltica]MCR1026988.1 hypothetical protein [Cellulophaga baltica]
MRVLLVISFFFTVMFCFAQQQDSIATPTIQVIARAQQNKILVRWAPTDAVIWQRANTYGYTLERFTVYRNGKRLDTPEKKQVATHILKPAPLASWEGLALANDNAAILAQAIYGDDFEIGSEEGQLMAVVNKVKQLEQRFSFALFAADMNFEAAKLAGLGFEDSSVKSNEGYLYQINTAIPSDLAVVKEGVVYIDASETDALPVPIDLAGVFKDKEVILTWEYELFKSVYATYYIERSEDGTHYKRLGDLPLVNLNNTEHSPTKRMYYIDTLAQNNKQYHYRVSGISPFGEEGKPSKAIVGQGQKALSATPFIINHELLVGTGAKIYWDFPKEKENEVATFEIRAASKDNGTYKILKDGISPQTRTGEIAAPFSVNYIKVIAIGKDSTETASFSALVQLIDSIAPAKPTGLRGVVDSLGVAIISWEPNMEKDILGYRIFRGNLKDETYAQITIDPLQTNQFIDTVQLNSLNTDVYYTVVAVDHRFNTSVYSEVLELKKPDIIPPSAPVFKNFKVLHTGVSLSWISSSSTDVTKHQLFRKSTKASGIWELVFETKDTITHFKDTELTAATKYTYAIKAVDESGLSSEDSPTITIKTASNTEDEVIKNLHAVVDRDHNTIRLYWRKLPDRIKELVIFKSKKDGKPITWKQLPAALTEIIDKNISPSNRYIYQIRPVFEDGSYGYLETLEVNY